MMPFYAASRRIANCEAIRPDIAGIMGAFGAALVARERFHAGDKTTMLSIDRINALTYYDHHDKMQGLYQSAAV